MFSHHQSKLGLKLINPSSPDFPANSASPSPVEWSVVTNCVCNKSRSILGPTGHYLVILSCHLLSSLHLKQSAKCTHLGRLKITSWCYGKNYFHIEELIEDIWCMMCIMFCLDLSDWSMSTMIPIDPPYDLISLGIIVPETWDEVTDSDPPYQTDI